MTANNLGVALMDLDRLDEAGELFQEAVDVLKGMEHPSDRQKKLRAHIEGKLTQLDAKRAEANAPAGGGVPR